MLSDGTPLGGEKNIGSIARWPESISSFVCERVHKLAHTHARTLREITSSVVARSLSSCWSTVRPAPVACSGLRQFGQRNGAPRCHWSHDPVRFDRSLCWTHTINDLSLFPLPRFFLLKRCTRAVELFQLYSLACRVASCFPFTHSLHLFRKLLHREHCTIIIISASSSSTSSSPPQHLSELCCRLKHFA